MRAATPGVKVAGVARASPRRSRPSRTIRSRCSASPTGWCRAWSRRRRHRSCTSCTRGGLPVSAVAPCIRSGPPRWRSSPPRRETRGRGRRWWGRRSRARTGREDPQMFAVTSFGCRSMTSGTALVLAGPGGTWTWYVRWIPSTMTVLVVSPGASTVFLQPVVLSATAGAALSAGSMAASAGRTVSPGVAASRRAASDRGLAQAPTRPKTARLTAHISYPVWIVLLLSTGHRRSTDWDLAWDPMAVPIDYTDLSSVSFEDTWLYRQQAVNSAPASVSQVIITNAVSVQNSTDVRPVDTYKQFREVEHTNVNGAALAKGGE